MGKTKQSFNIKISKRSALCLLFFQKVARKKIYFFISIYVQPQQLIHDKEVINFNNYEKSNSNGGLGVGSGTYRIHSL